MAQAQASSYQNTFCKEPTFLMLYVDVVLHIRVESKT